MNVLVDTSVWSLALRRRPEQLSRAERVLVAELSELIQEGRAKIIGPVRQEILSGIKAPQQFERLRGVLRAFPDELLDMEDFEAAASACNLCRSKGFVVSQVDALICAATHARAWTIFSTDTDFENYSRFLPIKMFITRS